MAMATNLSSRFLRLASQYGRGNGVCNMNTLSLANQVMKNKKLPEGIRLEVLNASHDISRLRQLLAGAFFFNDELLIRALCQRHYPGLTTIDQFRKVERKFEKIDPDQSLREKIKEGLSLVAVKDDDPSRFVSAIFAETYRGYIYEMSSLVNDDFCQDALNILRCVHEKAVPFLAAYPPEKVAFLSHAATCVEYRSTGIAEVTLDLLLSRLAKKGFEVAYGITTTNRVARYVTKRLNLLMIAEVMYKDYQHEGSKVFANVIESNESLRAFVKLL